MKDSVRLKRRKNARTKGWLHRHKALVASACFVLLVIAVLVLWLYRDFQKQNNYQVVSSQSGSINAGYMRIDYNGNTYRYNNRITSILYAGIDSDGDIQAKTAYVGAPRADSVSLVVLDEYHQRMTIIALNRDTMTGIHKYTVDGKDRGSFTDHLAFAYTYGDGGEVSCRNLCRAVSDLLFGIPIDGYVVSNRASLPLIGEAVGPVEVVVPNDSLEAIGFHVGSIAMIDSTNLMDFVRTRDTDADFSNVSRMERQEAYISAAIDKIVKLLTENSDTAWQLVIKAEKDILTSITRSRYLDLTRMLKNTSFGADSYYTPEGEQVAGSRHDEFYPDMEALHEKVIDLFYLEM